ncbi:MAG: hypothetical protein K9N55_05520 [Phycisphaerae bacterium]|nr:hypothetical protein [Phycisphaerae bacterium]
MRRLGIGPFRISLGREDTQSVDAHLTYHAGPRTKAIATFAGPFRVGQRIVSQEPPDLVMEVLQTHPQVLLYKISGPLAIDSETPCLAYGPDGRRHPLRT